MQANFYYNFLLLEDMNLSGFLHYCTMAMHLLQVPFNRLYPGCFVSESSVRLVVIATFFAKLLSHYQRTAQAISITMLLCNASGLPDKRSRED